MAVAQDKERVLEVGARGPEGQRRGQDVSHERVDNVAERPANDHTQGQVNGPAPVHKLTPLVPKVEHCLCTEREREKVKERKREREGGGGVENQTKMQGKGVGLVG